MPGCVPAVMAFQRCRLIVSDDRKSLCNGPCNEILKYEPAKWRGVIFASKCSSWQVEEKYRIYVLTKIYFIYTYAPLIFKKRSEVKFICTFSE